MFSYPRNCLLNFTSEFLTKCSVKLNEINKKSAQEKNLELLDQKCFIKLNEVLPSFPLLPGLRQLNVLPGRLEYDQACPL